MKILVVAPHPDDETLGAGGTLLKHVVKGDQVYWAVVTHTFSDSSLQYRNERTALIEKVSREYGFIDYFLMDYLAGALDTVSYRRIIDDLLAIIQKVQPNVVYSVSSGDVSTDHDIVYRCLMCALKPFYVPYVNEVFLYEVSSSTNWSFPDKASGFQPNVYVDIEKVIETKLSILELYKSELKDYPHPRSLEAVRMLAAYRGSAVNIRYAEAFQLVRRIIR